MWDGNLASCQSKAPFKRNKYINLFLPVKDTMKNFVSNIFNPLMAVPALKVALVVGSILFIINHGVSFYHGQMSLQRWVSAFLSYLVPYLVSIHGRSVSNQNG
jgi:hypothetical protein